MLLPCFFHEGDLDLMLTQRDIAPDTPPKTNRIGGGQEQRQGQGQGQGQGRPQQAGAGLQGDQQGRGGGGGGYDRRMDTVA